MSKRLIEFARVSHGAATKGRKDVDATVTDPAFYDPVAARSALPHDFKHITYKSDMGRGTELAKGTAMDMPYKYIWKDVHKELGLKDAIREAIGRNDTLVVGDLIRQALDSGDAKVSIDMRLNTFGYTALHLACKHGADKIVSTLLDFKASVNSLTQNRDTPLHLAVRSGHNMMRAVRSLLHAKAAVDIQTRLTRRTALHWACVVEGQRLAACAIANYTTDFSLKDSEGNTVVDYAQQRGLDDVLAVLEYMQNSANQLEVKRLQLLGEGGGRKRALTRQEKLLLKAGGQAGEEARRKSAEAARQEKFREEKEAMLAAQVEKEARELKERQDKVQDTVLRMREKVRAMGSRLEEQVHVLRKTNRSSEEADSSKGHRLEDTFVKQQRRVHGRKSVHQAMFPVPRVTRDASATLKDKQNAEAISGFSKIRVSERPSRRLMLSDGRLVHGQFESGPGGTTFVYHQPARPPQGDPPPPRAKRS